jgi:hypothetical protein
VPKRCCRCRKTKSLRDFHQGSRPDKRAGQCKPCANKASRAWRKLQLLTRPVSFRKIRDARTKLRKKNQKIEVFNHYSGGKCACCGENRIEFLTLDHVHGSGKKHRERLKIGGGQNFYKYLISRDFPSRPVLQVLCGSCHVAKSTYGYCPHKFEVKRGHKSP